MAYFGNCTAFDPLFNGIFRGICNDLIVTINNITDNTLTEYIESIYSFNMQ